MTKKSIDRLQNYYGIAVRANSYNLAQMKKPIHGTLFHVASSANNNYHTHCPTGENSWCRYQSDKVTGLKTYKPGPGLAIEVMKHVKPIFNDLSKDELFEKCKIKMRRSMASFGNDCRNQRMLHYLLRNWAHMMLLPISTLEKRVLA